MKARELQFVLEVINGAWALLSIALMMVCAAYLYHELVSRRIAFAWRKRWTRGMRVSAAIATLSLGIFVTRSTIYVWRHFFDGGDFSKLQLSLLIFGAAIGALGFLCAIREISRPLYGNRPWLVMLFLLVTTTLLMLAGHF